MNNAYVNNAYVISMLWCLFIYGLCDAAPMTSYMDEANGDINSDVQVCKSLIRFLSIPTTLGLGTDFNF